MRRGVPLNITWLWLALAVATAALYTARATVVTPRGLRAVYFAGTQPAGDGEVTAIDPVPSTKQIADRWRGAAPEEFNVQWTGFLTTWRSGTYTFALTTDDAGTLSIDGQPVVSIPGRHEAATLSGSIALEPGIHRVAIDYVQYGGDYVMVLSWAPDGGRLRPVPSWVLTPRRVRAQSIVIGRIVDLAAQTTLVLALLVGGWATWRRTSPVLRRAMEQERLHAPGTLAHDLRAPLARKPVAASLLLFAALAVVHTWPLASNPGHLTRHDNADTMLNEWIVAWVAHELPRDPAHVFDANIFYPERDTLAYSESLLTQSVMGMPLRWLGASPVLTYNILVIAGFMLTGWAMCLVMTRWTGSWVAGLVAGCLFGFNAHTLTRIPHLQALHVEFLPLALLAHDDLLRRPGVRHAISLVAWFVLQSLTSIHLFVFSGFALVAATIVRTDILRGPTRRRALVFLAPTTLLAVVLLLPFLLPYSHVSAEHGFKRTLEVVAGHAATWRDYLSTPARIHFSLWSSQFFAGTALFPGALGLLLAAIAIARGIAWTNPRARVFLAIAVVGIALSFGPELPGYALLYRLLPPLQAIRAVVRFGYLGIVGVAGVAGFGVVAIRRLLPAASWPVVSVLLVIIAALEPLAAPLGLRSFDRIPAIYSSLAGKEGAIVVEIPFQDGRGAASHAEYMLNSTAHWRPMLNGYSGFQPGSFHRNAESLRGFPDATSIDALRASKVTHVFVHADRISPERAAAVHSSTALRLLQSEGAIELYEVTGQ